MSQHVPILLDEPIYRCGVLPSFVHPIWFRRILFGGALLTGAALAAVLVGWLLRLCDPHSLLAALALVPFAWFGSLAVFPALISFLVRPLIFIQDDLFQALFHVPAARVYRFYGIFLEAFALIALYMNLCYAVAVSFGWAQLQFNHDA